MPSINTGFSAILSEVYSQPFSVHTAKRFPGVPGEPGLCRHSPLHSLTALTEQIRLRCPSHLATRARSYLWCVSLYSIFVRDVNMMISSGVATARAKGAGVAVKSRAMTTTKIDCLDDVVFPLCYLCCYDLYHSSVVCSRSLRCCTSNNLPPQPGRRLLWPIWRRTVSSWSQVLRLDYWRNRRYRQSSCK